MAKKAANKWGATSQVGLASQAKKDKKKDPKKGDKGKNNGGGGATATIPPLGSFDPALEAQRASGRRGLSDLVYDTQTGEVRGREDYTTQLAGYLRDYTRGGEDINRDTGRLNEDFGYQTQALDRRYAALGIGQGEAINKTGQIRGGALAASAAKRAGNKAFEFQPLQTAHTRGLADLTQRGARMGEDYSTNVNLAGRGFTRGQEDRSTNLSRATREQQIGEADITAQEYFDASQRNPTMTFPSSKYGGGGGTVKTPGVKPAAKPKKKGKK